MPMLIPDPDRNHQIMRETSLTVPALGIVSLVCALLESHSKPPKKPMQLDLDAERESVSLVEESQP